MKIGDAARLEPSNFASEPACAARDWDVLCVLALGQPRPQGACCVGVYRCGSALAASCAGNGRGDEEDTSQKHNERTTYLYSEQTWFVTQLRTTDQQRDTEQTTFSSLATN